MVDQTSLDLMDSVFACDDMESRAVLLYAIQDFLVAQAARVPGRAEESPEKGQSKAILLDCSNVSDTVLFSLSGGKHDRAYWRYRDLCGVWVSLIFWNFT